MITTKQINVNLSKGKIKLRHVTTKDIDAGVRVEPPKAPIKKKSLATITTTTLPDVADVAEKKRRDDIAEEKKLAMKDEKKIAIVREVKIIEPMETIAHPITKNYEEPLVTAGEYEIEVEKKPWNKMNAKERKEYRAEKAKNKEEKNEGKDKKD